MADLLAVSDILIQVESKAIAELELHEQSGNYASPSGGGVQDGAGIPCPRVVSNPRVASPQGQLQVRLDVDGAGQGPKDGHLSLPPLWQIRHHGTSGCQEKS
jgi:hypothetical protein